MSQERSDEDIVMLSSHKAGEKSLEGGPSALFQSRPASTKIDQCPRALVSAQTPLLRSNAYSRLKISCKNVKPSLSNDLKIARVQTNPPKIHAHSFTKQAIEPT